MSKKRKSALRFKVPMLALAIQCSVEAFIWVAHCMLAILTKGHLISKADWHAIDSPKNWTNEFDLFAVKSKRANKINSSVRFLGEVSRP